MKALNLTVSLGSNSGELSVVLKSSELIWFVTFYGRLIKMIREFLKLCHTEEQALYVKFSHQSLCLIAFAFAITLCQCFGSKHTVNVIFQQKH